MAAPLEAILRVLVARSFPELKRLRITIAFRDLGDEDDLLFYTIEAGQYFIGVAESLRGAPRRVLEGGIAHELSHILRDSRMGTYQRELAFESYERSTAYRVRDERATEMRLIARGYGEHLLAFIRYARARGWSFGREHGLTPAEVVRLMRPGH